VKIYENHYSLTSATGASEVFSLDFPQEAVIKKLTVQQLSGTDIAYTVALYNKDISSSTADESVKHTVIPDQSALAGDSVSLFQINYLHKNMEGTLSVPTRKIYLKMTATAAGAETWDVAIAGELITQPT